jgi:hypothetical protein
VPLYALTIILSLFCRFCYIDNLYDFFIDFFDYIYTTSSIYYLFNIIKFN